MTATRSALACWRFLAEEWSWVWVPSEFVSLTVVSDVCSVGCVSAVDSVDSVVCTAGEVVAWWVSEDHVV